MCSFFKILLATWQEEKNYSSFNMEVIKVSLKWKLFTSNSDLPQTNLLKPTHLSLLIESLAVLLEALLWHAQWSKRYTDKLLILALSSYTSLNLPPITLSTTATRVRHKCLLSTTSTLMQGLKGYCMLSETLKEKQNFREFMTKVYKLVVSYKNI